MLPRRPLVVELLPFLLEISGLLGGESLGAALQKNIKFRMEIIKKCTVHAYQTPTYQKK